MDDPASSSKLAEKLDAASKVQSNSMLFSKVRSKLSEALSELGDEKVFVHVF